MLIHGIYRYFNPVNTLIRGRPIAGVDVSSVRTIPQLCQGYRGRYRITGSVMVAGSPARRRVTLMDRKSLKVIEQTFSDSDSGEYSFELINPAIDYLVLCDDGHQVYNAAVADWVEPVAM